MTRALAWVVALAGGLVLLVLVYFLVYDVATARWINLPLDLIFGGAVALIVWFSARSLRRRR